MVSRHIDYVIKDLLGCVRHGDHTDVHVCVDPLSWQRSVEQFDGNDEFPVSQCDRMRAMLVRGENNTGTVSCGPCAPPASAKEKPARVIMITAFRSPNSPHFMDNDFSFSHEMFLRQSWAPRVLIHVNEEEPIEAQDLMKLYSGVPLVLKAYSHKHRDHVDGSGFSASATGSSEGAEHLRFDASPTDACEADAALGGAATHPLRAFMGRHLKVIPVGYFKEFLPLNMDGVAAARAALAGPSAAERALVWAFVGFREGHTRVSTDRRHAMSSTFSTVHPHQMLGEGNTHVPKASIFDTYRQSKFVASPSGVHHDCFRHYEAILAGAAPVVAAGARLAAWPWGYSTRSNRNSTAAPSEVGSAGAAHHNSPLLPLPAAPLGWVFPDSPKWEDELAHESYAEAQTRKCDQPCLGEFDLNHGFSSTWPRFAFDQTPWHGLAKKVRAMAPEEIDHRRELNARWYIQEIDSVRWRCTTHFSRPRPELLWYPDESHPGCKITTEFRCISA